MADLTYPDDLRYTKDHEWARISGNTITIGITAHAQNQLGDVVYVEIPQVGAEVKAGQPFGVVESTKAVSELFAPVTGKVVERNDKLVSTPDMLGEDPYGSGWMIKVEVKSSAEVEGLLDRQAYIKLLATEAH